MKLKQLREKLCWTQVQLALKSGVSQTYISELELNKKQPTITITKN
nr:helix-turn-helix transcriptional regulator [Desulforamulus aquiferis]